MRLELVDLISGGSLQPGEVVINLDRVIQTFAETDVTTVAKYRIEKQRNPNLTLDIEKEDLDDLMVDIYPDAAFPVDVIKKDGRVFIRDMSFKSSGVLYAFEDPEDSEQTVVLYEEDKASPTVTYHLDMPLVTISGGAVGFLNLFNSDSDGVPAATPTVQPSSPTTPAP